MTRVYVDRLVLTSSDEGVRWQREASNGRIRNYGTDHSKWYKRKSAMLANLRTENPLWWKLVIIDRTDMGEDASRRPSLVPPVGYHVRKTAAAGRL